MRRLCSWRDVLSWNVCETKPRERSQGEAKLAANKKECVCDPGYFGLFCEYHEACPSLELDKRTPPFPSVLGLPMTGTTFQPVYLTDTPGRPLLTIDSRPVYHAIDDIILPELKVGEVFIIFTKMQWIITMDLFLMESLDSCWKNVSDIVLRQRPAALVSPEEEQNESNTNTSALPSFLPNCTRPTGQQIYQHISAIAAKTRDAKHYGTIPALCISQDVAVGNPGVDTSSPDALRWSPGRELGNAWSGDDTHATDTMLLCAQCHDENNPCLNFGICFDHTSRCECPPPLPGAQYRAGLFNCSDVGALCECNTK